MTSSQLGHCGKKCSYFISIVNKLFDATGRVISALNIGHGADFTDQCFVLHEVQKSFILNLLKSLNTSKATGVDNIPARLLKDSAEVIAKCICHLVNISFNSGIVPRAGLRLWGARGHIFVGGPGPHFCGGPGTTFLGGPFPIPIGLTNYNIITKTLNHWCSPKNPLYMREKGEITNALYPNLKCLSAVREMKRAPRGDRNVRQY